MTMAPLSTYIDPLVSICLATGRLDRVNRHEPKSKPGSGLSCAVWLASVGPATNPRSSIRSTTGLIVINVRIVTPMLAPPEDEIDPAVYQVVTEIIEAISADFTLGGVCQAVDLLGMTGTALAAQAGYFSQDGTVYRAMTITVPMIVSDIWGQSS